MGIYNLAGSSIETVQPEYPEISILFVGNSITTESVAYVPYVLRTLFPEIRFRFYHGHNGGHTLAQQYTKFVNNQAFGIFCTCENAESWTMGSSVTMKAALQQYRFDIVCLQEYFYGRSTYTESDLAGWDNCVNYITQNYAGNNPLEYVTLLHAPSRTNIESEYSLTVNGNKLILNKTICSDLIPTGVAVYKAFSTDLDSLGDNGHLSPDNLHTQEGLPRLLEAYSTVLWLLRKLGVNKSIYDSPVRMTAAVYNSLTIPGPHLGSGVIPGTDAQNLLAQEVAIQAHKEGRKMVLDSFGEQA